MDETSSSSPLLPASAAPQLRFGKIDDLASRVAAAVDGARKSLFSQQHEEGYWCGELEADTTLESDYILLHTLLGTGNPERFRKCCNWILRHQNEDGGWGIYAGAPSNISASVKAYFGLKLSGYKADDPALVRARKKILEMGGVTEVNT
ncbi:MAG: prenyltransferase/squalene oxidase repeat-containing protein, partial [Terriglobales bacterium]